jgi:hypothetical protein
MVTPSLSFQSNQSTCALLCAAFEIAEFFVGTTEETTSFFTCRRLKNSATILVESTDVGTRVGLKTRSLDANASFAYELLTSINKYSERRATAKMQTPNAPRRQASCVAGEYDKFGSIAGVAPLNFPLWGSFQCYLTDVIKH